MSAPLYRTIVVPVNLGEASGFNRRMFPLSYYRRNNIGRGDFYLAATLEEMVKIKEMGAHAEQWQELIVTTRARYDQLMLQKEELETRPKSKNPFKYFANYRAARMFLAASKSFYVATRNRSEEVMRTIGRDWLSDPRDVELTNNEPPPGTNISGIAIKLPEGPLDDRTRKQLMDATDIITSYKGPFQDDQRASRASTLDEYVLAVDSLPPLFSEVAESLPDVATVPSSSSSGVVHHTYNFYSSVFSPNSNVHGATIQQGGSQNSGSVNHVIRPTK